MQLIPAIDIQNGACVRLLRGDFKTTTVYADDPLEPARRYGRLAAPVLHVVDLDGAAAGKPVNTALIGQIADVAGCPVQTGGGLRDEQGVETALGSARRAVVGSIAVSDRRLTTRLLRRFGSERIVLALDVRQRDGTYRVCTDGWTVETDTELAGLLRDYTAADLRHVLVTDIERDGALTGPNTLLYREIVRDFPWLAVQASGGIRNVEDLIALSGAGVAGAISGKALLENRITDEEMAPYLLNE